MCIWIKGVLRNFCFASEMQHHVLFSVFMHQLATIEILSFCNIFIHFLSCKYDYTSSCWTFHIMITSWHAQLLLGFSTDHHPFSAPTLPGPATLTTYMLSLHPLISFPNTTINVKKDFPSSPARCQHIPDLTSSPRPRTLINSLAKCNSHLVRYSMSMFSYHILHNNF